MNIQQIPSLVINLPKRKDRLLGFKEELKHIGSPDFIVIDGIIDEVNVHKGISQAHVNCVKWAKENNVPYVLIMEDDVLFQAKERTLDYINECFDNLPSDWDILLGGVSFAKGMKKYNDYWNEIGDLCGTHFYVVNSKAYDKIIAFDCNTYFDRWIGRNKDLKTFVARKFFAIQSEGFSDNTGKKEDYSRLFRKFQLL